MTNQEIARIFYEMADILEMQGVEWKPVAFRRAARNIDTLACDVSEIFRREGIAGLRTIPGVGEGIAKKIIQYVTKGKIDEYERLRKSLPKGVYELMHVHGLGPKKAWKLYRKLHIDSLKKLERAATRGLIRKLEGFGEKSEEDILSGLLLVHRGEERKLLGYVLPIAQEMKAQLEKLPFVERVDIAGSLRRMKETIRDIDLLVISRKPAHVMDFFVNMDNVKTVLAKGGTKASVALKEGVNCDVRVVDKKSYGAALQYFSGSKEHVVATRQLAIKKGYKLNEYGLFKTAKGKGAAVATRDEEDIYRALGLQYIPPELREDQGEINAAMKRKLPRLIPYDAIKGDLHMHTTWSDGTASTEAMVKAAIAMRYQYVAITDHSKSTYVAHGLDEKQAMKHLAEIRTLQRKYPQIRILAGVELDILPSGKLDYADATLKELDFVLVAIHSRFKASKQEMTKRILMALDNKYVCAVAHPSGRLINEREPYALDFEKITEKGVERGIAFEVNAHPTRLDLHDASVRKVIEAGGKICINTDSHAPDHLRYMTYGVAQARRGWAEAKDVINAWPLKKFEKFIAR